MAIIVNAIMQAAKSSIEICEEVGHDSPHIRVLATCDSSRGLEEVAEGALKSLFIKLRSAHKELVERGIIRRSLSEIIG
jgi:hypothetical protein